MAEKNFFHSFLKKRISRLIDDFVSQRLELCETHRQTDSTWQPVRMNLAVRASAQRTRQAVHTEAIIIIVQGSRIRTCQRIRIRTRIKRGQN